MDTIDAAGRVHVNCTKCDDNIILEPNKSHINHQGPWIVRCLHCGTQMDIQDLVAEWRQKEKEKVRKCTKTFRKEDVMDNKQWQQIKDMMGKEYKQLKEIRLQDVLDLEEGFLKYQCIERLINYEFIEEKKPEWKKITLRDLHKIRPGVTLKRILSQSYERIINVVSDPYWSTWNLEHVFVYKERRSSGQEKESRINGLFDDGEVYIQV